MFRRLMVPLDGSQLSEAVLPAVALLAKRAAARVTLLHVLERHAPASVHGDRHLTTAAEAEDYFRELAQQHFPPAVTVDWHVHRRETSDVAHSVADHADELESDLVIMLAHGRKQFRHRMFGTVAQQVARQGPAPILWLQPGPDGRIRLPFRHLLVPLDGRAEHESGLPVAQEMARLCAASVQLLMVVPTRFTLAGADAATGHLLPAATEEVLALAEQQGAKYLERHLVPFQAAGVAAGGLVARGEPATVICDTALRREADLLVLGTHGLAGTEAFWSGSLGQKLISRLTTSFLLAPAREG